MNATTLNAVLFSCLLAVSPGHPAPLLFLLTGRSLILVVTAVNNTIKLEHSLHIALPPIKGQLNPSG